MGVHGRPAVAGVTVNPGPREGTDDARGRRDLPYHRLVGVCNEKVIGGIDSEAERVQFRGRGSSPIPGVTVNPVPGVGTNDAGRRDLPHGIGCKVGDIEVAEGIKRHESGGFQFGGRGRSPITRISAYSISGESGDDPGGGGDFPHHVICILSDINVPILINRHGIGSPNFSRCGWPAIPRVTRGAGSRESGNGG